MRYLLKKSETKRGSETPRCIVGLNVCVVFVVGLKVCDNGLYLCVVGLHVVVVGYEYSGVSLLPPCFKLFL